MARIKSTNFYQKSGKVANEVFSNLGNGVVGCRAQNSKQAPLNAEQKINASGFSALNAEVRYLNPVLRVTFPRDTNGTKWANRFTSVNKKREGVLTTTKINPDTPVDPKKKANEEYTSEIDWTKVLRRVNQQVQNYKTCLKNSHFGVEKFNFSLGLSFNFFCIDIILLSV